MQFNKTSNERKKPINRNTLFYSEESAEYEKEIGKNYLEQDVGQSLILYSIDLSKTNIDDIYGESDESGLSFFPPVEFPCLYDIKDSEIKTFNNDRKLGVYNQTGKLVFGVYVETLDELNISIKKGDIIGCQVTESHMEYFEINYSPNNYSNSQSLFGTQPFYYTFECSPIDSSNIKF